ncbi:hypothetical protein B0H19DRAFT_1169004 [Mycena capillaripes]|nr:hypothetical protein B0H19DRAFT_1169004 [Mycena capillaripes]
MTSFPWENLKAETLRSVCKDLGADSTTKRNRDAMVAFLKDVETRGLASVFSSHEGPPATKTAAVAIPADASPATVSLPHDGAPEDIEMNFGLGEEPTCGCEHGWLSPRTKFVLKVTAGVAQDLVRDTGELAGEYGHVGATYLANYMSADLLPRGKKAAGDWVEGFSMLFEIISQVFEDGKIPTADEVDKALELANRSQLKLFTAYAKKGAGCEDALEALVRGAKSDWEGEDFKDTYCEEEEWNALPTCAKHDFDWNLAIDMLAG